ncbi:uncharacterized protein LOC119463076 [Dermacentor silvarum]|uniref:uncharacterized protein LOC119463076 n=1 Tax=Dermacentor silvarum TaxID=543639 RepID=UPI001899C417|nr:uncharacterized protein LOC119463076 [Dermacentor silvarum]XP_037580037.1 uncharacterized protein LOC119463076 [Dermacentor silvarum]XP_049524002.1 uncharacterized protein LOC119463076 [Dermacentor silvarum]XP_049524005.1 uncharacterized protein LOC119463076 [Dermacentor silvarum]XP_049524008.1 uncharacterized protein LOC119463076 [Dermacentor silvarum]XP_049524013.1 uncharacterized protein LOC119463076 [Dermacentor silvarum]XP_049524017.1 uncharacterized protein LOC119463076 [Dermacentor 
MASPRPAMERGCSRVCVILLYLTGMLLIIAGAVAGGFIVNYPDILFYLALASGSAIVLGILFVSLSACVCSRRRPPSSKDAQRKFAAPTSNGVKGSLATDFKEASVGSREELNGSAPSSRPSDGLLNIALEKGEFFHNSSIDASNPKKAQQKPVTSSPRTTKAKLARDDAVFPEPPKVAEISAAHRSQPDSLRKAKAKNGKLPKSPASVGDFASLGFQEDDGVFAPEEAKSKPSVKGRGRVPLTAFKQTSKSVSDLDDESSFDSTTRAPQQRTATTRPETPQMEPRLAVSCHNILSEEPVRVGIAHLRQREDTVARKPPVPRKVTGIALPGMVQRAPAAGASSQSQDDLSRVRLKPTEQKPRGSLRDQVPEDGKQRLQHKSVPDFFLQDGGAKLTLLDSSSSSYGKSSRTTAPETPLNTSMASYAEPVGPEDLHRCNTVGLPPVPLPKPATSGQQFRLYTPKEDALVMDKQPLMADWAASVSSKSDTFSSDEAECQRQLSSSQELLMGSVKCLETEI